MKKSIMMLSIFVLTIASTVPAHALVLCFCNHGTGCCLGIYPNNNPPASLMALFSNEGSSGTIDNQNNLIFKPASRVKDDVISFKEDIAFAACKGESFKATMKAGTYKRQKDGSYIIPLK